METNFRLILAILFVAKFMCFITHVFYSLGLSQLQLPTVQANLLDKSKLCYSNLNESLYSDALLQIMNKIVVNKFAIVFTNFSSRIIKLLNVTVNIIYYKIY